MTEETSTPMTVDDWNDKIEAVFSIHEDNYGPIPMASELVAVLAQEIFDEQDELSATLKINSALTEDIRTEIAKLGDKLNEITLMLNE